MRIGADTGFIISLIAGNQSVKRHWEDVVAGQSELILSVITINEILTHAFKHGTGDKAKEWIHLLKSLPGVSFLDVTAEIAEQSAGYRWGLGMPTVDSLILATFVQAGCGLVLSADSDFELAAKQSIIVLELLN